jgi:redox-sensing transcriptional repressor
VAKVKISAAPSIRRLPSYLHIIRRFQNEGDGFISGTVIAQELNLEPIQVRKDLAITGITGKPKKGYPVQALIEAIEHFLDWDSPRGAVLAGAGNLGTALLGYGEFRRHGLRVVAAFDRDPRKIGSDVHGVPVFDTADMEERIRSLGVAAAILTVPFDQAQETADILVRAGIRGIWNFTNVKLKVPERVVVQKEDLSSGYAMFCVMLQAKKPEEDGKHGAGEN